MTSYLPGHAPGVSLPLSRYLPPIPEGAAAAWLGEHLPPGSWVLEPFGASPLLAVEIARAGYRVLVAANNPIVRFLLEMLASPPPRDELQASLAALAVARRGEERLEPHILSLYDTTCDHCRASISANAFLWEKDAEGPFARIYHCPHCEEEGEYPATEADALQAARFAASGLHHARALERVLPLRDPDREHVEAALRVYPPRAVYALFNLINKLDGLPLALDRRRLLTALLLSVFDQTNTLWPYPTARARPKQLTVPPRYLERNVWKALEDAIQAWDWPGQPAVPLSWVRSPGDLQGDLTASRQGGIALFQGRLKDLLESLTAVEIQAVVTAIPRPNQAFWTLSALWSGWLWGTEAIGPFRSVLRRRRYDWVWHTSALHAAMRRLARRLYPGTPVFGLLSEAEPGLVTAALVAAHMSNFEISGIALRNADQQAQLSWRAGEVTEASSMTRDERAAIVQRAARDSLQQRGEPGPYLPLQAAALAELAAEQSLVLPGQQPGEATTALRDLLEHALPHHAGLVRYGGSPHALRIGQWWLSDPSQAETPLSDRVETALLEYLSTHPGSTLAQIDAAMCQAFPGLLTPEHELVCACLESYGEVHPLDRERWFIRSQDQPAQRELDLAEMRAILADLGERLGFRVLNHPELVWEANGGKHKTSFFIQTSASLGEIIFQHTPTPGHAFILIPGGRSNLVAYKLRHDPRLAQAVEGRWRFLKFRHLRRLSDNPLLTPETLDEQFSLDPMTYESPQMRLL